jgi:hypothetical protein
MPAMEPIPEEELAKLDGLISVLATSQQMLDVKKAAKNEKQLHAIFNLICKGYYPEDIQKDYDKYVRYRKTMPTGKFAWCYSTRRSRWLLTLLTMPLFRGLVPQQTTNPNLIFSPNSGSTPKFVSSSACKYSLLQSVLTCEHYRALRVIAKAEPRQLCCQSNG